MCAQSMQYVGIVEDFLPKNRGNDDERNGPYGEDFPGFVRLVG